MANAQWGIGELLGREQIRRIRDAVSASEAGLALGPAIFGIVSLTLDLTPGNPASTYTLGIALWMAVWWMTEAVPIPVTALLPVLLFPLTGVMDGGRVASQYFNSTIFLFIGGFLVALAMQRWDLHSRIALRILLLFGTRPLTVLLGFMVSTAFLSMWVSNTATAMMMVPVAMAVGGALTERPRESGEDPTPKSTPYVVALLLGVAYSASIGGIATLVGTPPNLSFSRIFAISFPEAPEISFAQWLIFAFPVTVALLTVTWGLLAVWKARDVELQPTSATVIRVRYSALGPFRFEQKVVLTAFVALAVLWITRADVDLGAFTFKGWANLFGNPGYINDGTVAVAIGVILFMIPARSEPGKRVMDWDTAGKLRWDIVLLFGGGFALAAAFLDSGLANWFGQELSDLDNVPVIVTVAAIALVITFVTELNSNTATTETVLPALAGIAVGADIHPLILMLPATLAASLAFMMPVATPPNAIVFGSGVVRIPEMARIGLVLNLAGVVVVTAAVLLIAPAVFGFDLSEVPDWVGPR